MTVIGLSMGLSKAQGWDRVYKKAYVSVREINLERGLKTFEKY